MSSSDSEERATPASTGHPTVSIVIPAYNCAHLLGRTLDSVLAQTLPTWELVVSDDGSTDGSVEVAERYATSDPRIQVITSANGGVARARNRGFEATDARSKYVTFLDHDDRWFPHTLAALVEVLEQRPDLVSVYGLARCIDSDDRLIPGDDLEERMRERFEYRGWDLVALDPHEPTTFAGMVVHNYPTTPGLHLVRREVIERVGPFDPSTPPADDWDMAIRISRVGPIGFLDRLVLEWRRHGDAESDRSPRWRQAHWGVRAKTLASPENSAKQVRLARIGYLGTSRRSLRQSLSDLRGRQPRAALRNAMRAMDAALQCGGATLRRHARRRRAGNEGSATSSRLGWEEVGR